MIFSMSIVATAAALFSQTISVSAITAEEECGSLGVMKIPDILPEGITASQFRKCAAHPTGPINGTHLRDTRSIVSRSTQACETKAPFGCSEDGFCWKVCGSGGEWCWTAGGGGNGAWKTCNTFKDCGDDDSFACGLGCGDKCGCSC